MTRILLIVLLAAACGGSSATPDPGARDASTGPDAATPDAHRCDLADCQDGFARTCDSNPQTLDCTAFGASCAAFTDAETQVPFNWCSCGTLEESEGFCTGGRYGVTCLGGLGGLTDCGVGFVCAERPNGPFGIGCDCNNFADGICPAISCGSDPDCAQCTPSCEGRQCGDNGCGGECGTCDFGASCTAVGTCETICVPDCEGKQCGSDGCGGTCGSCDGTCSPAGQCQGACVPSCTGATCGSDGCGGTCGSCAEGLECSSGACACPFFDVLEYTFAIAPQSEFPPNFGFVAVNVTHTGLDGATKLDGEFMGFDASSKQTYVFAVYGCKPNLRIKREYALAGRSCVADETFTDRTSFVIPAPIMHADGSCTAPPL